MKSITVALPAYNEAENIPAMVEEVVNTLESLGRTYEVIVVNDGSRDNTAAVVRELEARYPHVRLVDHEVNQGYGAAVWTGLTSAKTDLVFFTDADRQFDLGELPKLLAKIDQADLVVGYRSPRRDPLMRRLNGWGWSRLVTLLFGYTARDIDCAFKLMQRHVVDTLKDQVQSRGATFSAEFLVRAKRAGFRFEEVAINGHRPRVAGNPTGAKLSVILRAFRELIAVRSQLAQQEQTKTKHI
ncbi:glycosyltransferase family 2 protein [Herpetosiphon sp. NSE202]|uniref:glycosyltransferase family 2 protein n=1 Tax=Herpetosiphon sp. NSE202 TaxID=3351349 RepID=UPI0036325701